MPTNSSYSGKLKNPKNPKKEIDNHLLQTFKEKSEKLGISSVGYVKIPEDIFNKKSELKYSNAIVLTTPIDLNYVNKKPQSEKAETLYNEYINFKKVSYALSDFLRKKEYTTQFLHPAGELINLTKLGQLAGLGYIGKNGLLISPELGPKLKISAILTTIENLAYLEKNPHEWIKDYCKTCDNCIKACPESALIEKEDKSAIADFNEEKCNIGCEKGCTYCISQCPFFIKGYDGVKKETTIKYI